MKVKELRSWLENFGEKHKQHYKRGISHVPQVNQDENLLSIQSKPSNASTSPMSSSGSIVSEDGVSVAVAFSPSPTGFSDTKRSFGAQINALDLAEGDSYPDPSFVDLSDESSVEDDGNFEQFQLFSETFNPVFDESNIPPESIKSRRVTFGGIQGAGSHSAPIIAKRASLANETTGTISTLRPSDVTIKVVDQTLPEAPHVKSIFRKKTDPVALKILQPTKQQASTESSARKPVRASRSSVGAAIELFGGQGSRKSIVSRRTDELQRLWSESWAITHVKKTKWCVCEKTGVYKRKIVVEPEQKLAS
jgi:hypothetical protein